MSLQTKLDSIYQATGKDSMDAFYNWCSLQFVLPYLNNAKNVLELSTNVDSSLELAQHCGKLTVVDGSSDKIEALEVACSWRHQVDNIYPVHSLFEEFEVAGQYDEIVMLHALEHIREEYRGKLLESIKGWLKPDGAFTVSVPNGNSLHRRLGVELGILTSVHQFSQSDYEKGHETVYDVDSLQNELKRSGFRIQNLDGYFVKTVPDQQMKDNSDFYTNDYLRANFELSRKLEPDICAELIVRCVHA